MSGEPKDAPVAPDTPDTPDAPDAPDANVAHETPDAPDATETSEVAVDDVDAEPEDTLAETVTTTLTKQEKSAKRWAETKMDIKWATSLLFVLLLALSGGAWNKWRGATNGEENLDAVTDLIFSQSGLVAPFEILSVLLLAALVAGIAMATRDPRRPSKDEAWRERDAEIDYMEREA